MANLGILYHELIEMGFERYDYEDSVYYKQKGYHPFVLTFDLAKNFKMEINDERLYATLYKAEKKPYDSNFKSYAQLNTKEAIQMCFAVFGFKKQAGKLIDLRAFAVNPSTDKHEPQ